MSELKKWNTGAGKYFLNSKTITMSRFIFYLLFLLALLPSLQGQNKLDKKWLVSIDFGRQKHDKRLYHWPKFPARYILARTPEEYGTYQWSVHISKKVFNYKKFDLLAGVGLSTEMATFFRPFNHLYGEEYGPYILLYTDRYFQNLIQLPVKLRYDFFEKIRLGLTFDILPQFNFFTKADHSTDEFGPNLYTWWGFHFYSIELNPGIELSIWRLHFGIKYRAFQIKKIDPILFYSTSVYTIEDTFETYNPYKLWFSMGYEF